MKAETFLAIPRRWPWGRIATDTGASGRRAALSPGQGGPFELDCGRAPRRCPSLPGTAGDSSRQASACWHSLRRRHAPVRGPAPAPDAAVAAAARDAEAGRARAERPRQARRGDRPARPGRLRRRRPLVRPAAGGHAGESIGLINAFSARLDARDAQRLAAQPGVLAVSLNGTTKPQSARLQAEQARDLLQPVRQHAAGVEARDRQGRGRRRGRHGHRRRPGRLPRRRRQRSRVVASAVTNPDATTPRTPTATARTSRADRRQQQQPRAGRPAARQVRGRRAGRAPDLDQGQRRHGDASVLDVIYGLQFAVDHMDDFNIRVVNLSLESTAAESYRTDPLDAAVEAAWFKGIVVVAAAGNRGSDSDAVDYAPGNDPYAISVGAVDDQGTKQTNGRPARRTGRAAAPRRTDTPSPTSTRPGARMVSNLAPGSDFASMCADVRVRRRPVHPRRRHVDVGAGRGRRRGGAAREAPLVDARPGEGRARQQPALAARRRRRGRRAGGLQRLQARARLEPGPRAERDRRPRHRRGRLGPLPLEPVALEPHALEPHVGWSVATGDLSPSWAQDSYVCDCSWTTATAIDPSRSRWSRSSWSRSRWSGRAGAGLAGPARAGAASSWSRSSWSTVGWSRSSWSQSSWSRSSWSRSS